MKIIGTIFGTSSSQQKIATTKTRTPRDTHRGQREQEQATNKEREKNKQEGGDKTTRATTAKNNIYSIYTVAIYCTHQ